MCYCNDYYPYHWDEPIIKESLTDIEEKHKN
jgi:hypothetical protein